MNYFNLYTPIQHFRKPEVAPGGLCWIVFAPFEDVDQWPMVNPKTGLCSTAITLKPGKTWFECQVTDRNRSFTEDLKVSSAGPFWEMKVTGYLGGNNSVLTLSSGVLPFHQYVVMFKDRDGQIRFIGNQDSGADIAIQYTSGEKDASRKRTITFSWENQLPARIYIGSLKDIEDDLIIPPFGQGGDFNEDYNEDFN